MSRRQVFDFREWVGLGGRVSEKHELFKDLAMLGYDECEMFAMLDFIEWFANNPDATIEQCMKEGIKRIGMARLMPHTKELTKLSMMLGDTKRSKSMKR